MTRILFTDAYPDHVGGAQRTLAEIATGLSDRFEVSAANVAEGSAAALWRSSGLTVHIVEYPPALQAYHGELLTGGVHRTLAAAGALARHVISAMRLLRRERIDVVYCSNVRSMLSFGLAARLTRRPTVLYMQQQQKGFGRLGRAAARLSTRIVSLSDRMENVFPDGVPADRFRVIPLGIDLSRWSPTDTPIAGVEAPVIACVGTVTRSKGIDVVVDALIRVRYDHDVTLRVVGAPVDAADESYATEVRRVADDAGVGDAIEWWGATDDVRGALEGVTVLVSGSRSEGTPRSIMEAMALGLPTVATDVGAVRDLVDDEVTGLVVPADRADALAEAIGRLLAEPAAATRLGAAAREYALVHLDLADTVSAFAEEFEALERTRR